MQYRRHHHHIKFLTAHAEVVAVECLAQSAGLQNKQVILAVPADALLQREFCD